MKNPRINRGFFISPTDLIRSPSFYYWDNPVNLSLDQEKKKFFKKYKIIFG